jgi:hypothetical protein
VPSGLTPSMGSTTVCRGSLRAGCGCRLLGPFGGVCGGTTGLASGNSLAMLGRFKKGLREAGYVEAENVTIVSAAFG